MPYACPHPLQRVCLRRVQTDARSSMSAASTEVAIALAGQATGGTGPGGRATRRGAAGRRGCAGRGRRGLGTGIEVVAAYAKMILDVLHATQVVHDVLGGVLHPARAHAA